MTAEELLVGSYLTAAFVGAVAVYVLSRKSIKKAWIAGAIIFGVYAAASMLICRYFNDWELAWLTANFACCQPMFWGLITYLNDGARDWNAIISNGGYIFVAYVTYRTEGYDPMRHSIFSKPYKYIYKYRDCDGLTKSGSIDLRQGWGSVANKKFIMIHQLGKPQIRKILFEYASPEMYNRCNKGIFIRPGIDPRNSAIEDDKELRAKYTT